MEGRPHSVSGLRFWTSSPAVRFPFDHPSFAVAVGPPWHFLYFLPLPHGQGWLRPIFGLRINGPCECGIWDFRFWITASGWGLCSAREEADGLWAGACRWRVSPVAFLSTVAVSPCCGPCGRSPAAVFNPGSE